MMGRKNMLLRSKAVSPTAARLDITRMAREPALAGSRGSGRESDRGALPVLFTIAAAVVVVGRVPAVVPLLLLPLAAVPPLTTGRPATRTIERAKTQTPTSARDAPNYFCWFRQTHCRTFGT
jgi:hypothetical protein